MVIISIEFNFLKNDLLINIIILNQEVNHILIIGNK